MWLDQVAFSPKKLLDQDLLHANLLHQEASTPKSFHTKKPLRQLAFTPRICYTKMLFHQRSTTPSSFYTKKFGQENICTPTCFYTRAHFSASFYTSKVLQCFTPRSLYTKTILHRNTFYTKTLLHKASFYTAKLVTPRVFDANTPLHQVILPIYLQPSLAFLFCRSIPTLPSENHLNIFVAFTPLFFLNTR